MCSWFQQKELICDSCFEQPKNSFRFGARKFVLVYNFSKIFISEGLVVGLLVINS